MRVNVELSLIPIGAGTSLSEYVAACERVLGEAGLTVELHANGTNVTGDWDTVMAAVRRCHEVVHGMGVPRITTTVKVSTRTDREQTLEDMVQSVRSRL